jgi:DNA-binding MarR family transcriptional regulator
MQDLLEAFFWENRRLFRALAVVADAALVPLGIQASGRALLEFLARESGPISLSELARKHSVSRQHIHQSLKRLRNRDWVEKLPDPDDARSVLLRLSGEGKAFWKEIRAVDHAILRRIARHIDSAGIQRATKTLRRFRELLEEASHE